MHFFNLSFYIPTNIKLTYFKIYIKKHFIKGNKDDVLISLIYQEENINTVNNANKTFFCQNYSL